jgi:uracil-DNA glycosylase
MQEAEPNDASPFLPETRSLESLREAAAGCRGCHLWREATQTVFGDGLERSRMMLVSEVPGDREDREGRPFVGPAGRELDQALEAVGIDRREVYVTNVVKHFKFERRGARRMHQTPKRFEVEACRPWLDEELAQVSPEALAVLGATAGKALFGASFRIGAARGKLLDSDLAPLVAATVHPSAILRTRDEEQRRAERQRFTEDLETLVNALG